MGMSKISPQCAEITDDDLEEARAAALNLARHLRPNAHNMSTIAYRRLALQCLESQILPALGVPSALVMENPTTKLESLETPRFYL